jgi:hypothetical protein
VKEGRIIVKNKMLRMRKETFMASPLRNYPSIFRKIMLGITAINLRIPGLRA